MIDHYVILNYSHVLLYDISNGMNNLLINQDIQEYLIATNRFNLLNSISQIIYNV